MKSCGPGSAEQPTLSQDLGAAVVELVDVDGDVEAAGLDLQRAVDVGVQVVPDGLAEGAAVAGGVLGAAAGGWCPGTKRSAWIGRLGRVDARLDLLARQARFGAVDRRRLQVVVVARHDGERDGGDDQRARAPPARRSGRVTASHAPRWTL